MQTAPVSNGTGSTGTTKQVGQLGKDDFLRLLMAQLQNQDPLKPMDDTQFIAQMAQFTTLEKMQDMSDRIAVLLEVEQLGQANGLIGKVVTALDASSGGTITGTVDSAKMVDGSAVLMVGGKPVPLSAVFSVEEVDARQLTQATSFIGKEVEARAGTNGDTVKGVIDAVKRVDGKVVLMMGTRSIDLADVLSIAEVED